MSNKPTEKQQKVFDEIGEEISEILMDTLDKHKYKEDDDREMIDPILYSALSVAAEFAYNIGYDRGEILDKVCYALDDAMEYEKQILCDDEKETLIVKDDDINLLN